MRYSHHDNSGSFLSNLTRRGVQSWDIWNVMSLYVRTITLSAPVSVMRCERSRFDIFDRISLKRATASAAVGLSSGFMGVMYSMSGLTKSTLPCTCDYGKQVIREIASEWTEINKPRPESDGKPCPRCTRPTYTDHMVWCWTALVLVLDNKYQSRNLDP